VTTPGRETPMLLSRDELEVIERCILFVLEQRVLPREDERDARRVLESIRTYLDDQYEKDQADAQDPNAGAEGAEPAEPPELPGAGHPDPPK